MSDRAKRQLDQLLDMTYIELWDDHADELTESLQDSDVEEVFKYALEQYLSLTTDVWTQGYLHVLLHLARRHSATEEEYVSILQQNLRRRDEEVFELVTDEDMLQRLSPGSIISLKFCAPLCLLGAIVGNWRHLCRCLKLAFSRHLRR